MGFRVNWARGLRQVRAMISLPPAHATGTSCQPVPLDSKSGETEFAAVVTSGWKRWLLGLLPPAAIGRIAALFLFLVSLKMILLYELRRHLQETHWRVDFHVPG